MTAGAIALILLLVVGVPYAYIHWIEGEAPAPLSLADVTTSPTAEGATAATATQDTSPAQNATTDTGPAVTTASGPEDAVTLGTGATVTGASGTGPDSGSGGAAALDGQWTIGSGSQAGYRVHETLAGQATTAVGRTDEVSGSVTISGDTLVAAEITVQIASIASDNGQRDSRFHGRIMDAAQYPTAAFALTSPSVLPSDMADGASYPLSMTGDLTLRGVTRSVTIAATVQRTGGSLAATGTIDVAYADYGIDNPSIGGFVSVGDAGTIEFLIVAARS